MRKIAPCIGAGFFLIPSLFDGAVYCHIPFDKLRANGAIYGVIIENWCYSVHVGLVLDRFWGFIFDDV